MKTLSTSSLYPPIITVFSARCLLALKVLPALSVIRLLKKKQQREVTSTFQKGETDVVNIGLQYPEVGIYKMWATFRYNDPKKNELQY